MHQHLTLLLLFVVLLPIYSCSSSSSCTDNHQLNTEIMAETTEALAAEFRQLRTVRGHWAGGEFVSEVDGFNGRKHVVMTKLGEQLGHGHSTAQVIELLGEPDLRVNNLDQIRNEPGQVDESQAVYLIYYWRGLHDYLHFKTQGQSVLAAEWYLAYE